MNNYNASQVGVPYVRAHKLTVNWPDNGQMPTAVIEQSLGVKLADGTVRELERMSDLTVPLDFSTGNTPIPLVSPEDGSLLGADTTLNQAFVAVLAVIRAAQIKAETPN